MSLVLPPNAKERPEEIPNTVCPHMSSVQLVPDHAGGVQAVVLNRPCIKQCVYFDEGYLSNCRMTGCLNDT